MYLLNFVIAATAGFLVGLPTGPARFFVIDTRLQAGRKEALYNYMGFFAAVVPYALLALMADDYISAHPIVEAWSHLIASGVLILWGLFIIKQSRKKKLPSSKAAADKGKPFWKGIMAGISNPVTPFIYLALLQSLKNINNEHSSIEKIVLLLVFEAAGFLTTWMIGSFISKKKNSFAPYWRKIKLIVGLTLITLGVVGVFQRVDFGEGIRLEIKREQQLDLN